jgi:hypothetical protein
VADADALKVARTNATVGALLERWEQHEIEPTTRMTYEAQIRLYIVPKLGDVRSFCSCVKPHPGWSRSMRSCGNAGPCAPGNGSSRSTLVSARTTASRPAASHRSARPTPRRACARSTRSSPERARAVRWGRVVTRPSRFDHIEPTQRVMEVMVALI